MLLGKYINDVYLINGKYGLCVSTKCNKTGKIIYVRIKDNKNIDLKNAI